MNNKTFHFVIFFILLCAILCTAESSYAFETVNEPPKRWEYSLSLGIMDFSEEKVKSAPFVELRVQRRLAYPLLFGASFEAAKLDDAIFGGLYFPASVRLPVHKSLKCDIVASPGIAYAKGGGGLDEWIGALNTGLEMKGFLSKGSSIALGVYYQLHTASQFNGYRLAVVVGF